MNRRNEITFGKARCYTQALVAASAAAAPCAGNRSGEQRPIRTYPRASGDAAIADRYTAALTSAYATSAAALSARG